jgi:hypothetical protein
MAETMPPAACKRWLVTIARQHGDMDLPANLAGADWDSVILAVGKMLAKLKGVSGSLVDDISGLPKKYRLGEDAAVGVASGGRDYPERKAPSGGRSPQFSGIGMSLSAMDRAEALEQKLRDREDELQRARIKRQGKDASRVVAAFFETVR